MKLRALISAAVLAGAMAAPLAATGPPAAASASQVAPSYRVTLSGSCWTATVTGTHVVYGGSVTVDMTRFTTGCSGTWSAEEACYEPGVGTNWNIGGARSLPGTETIHCASYKENVHGGVRVGGSYHGAW